MKKLLLHLLLFAGISQSLTANNTDSPNAQASSSTTSPKEKMKKITKKEKFVQETLKKIDTQERNACLCACASLAYYSYSAAVEYCNGDIENAFWSAISGVMPSATLLYWLTNKSYTQQYKEITK